MQDEIAADQETEAQSTEAQSAANPEDSTTEDGAQAEKTVKKGEPTHLYYEVENELLSKPNALADILQSEGVPASVVFCNSPSEADLVEVMLKKRSVSVSKLIGHVSYQRVAEASSEARSGELSVLVVTDVASRELDLSPFQLLFNYSIHEDPEIYLHRMAEHETPESLRSVISLVSPLDFGNFHYLKKIVDFDFEKAELPSKESLQKAQSESFLAESAEKGAAISSEHIIEMTKLVLEHEKKDDIIRELVNIALVTVPELKQSLSERGSRGRGRNRGDRDNRGDREDRGRGRDRDRGDRDRDGRGRDRDRNSRDRKDDRPQRRDLPPPKKDVRLYVGHGLENDFSEEEFTKIAKEQCEITDEQLKRFSVRNHYSFVDIPEECAEELLTKLEAATRSSGDSLFVTKATTITAPREEQSEEKDKSDASSEESAEAKSPDEQEASENASSNGTAEAADETSADEATEKLAANDSE